MTKFFSHYCEFQDLNIGRMIGNVEMCSNLYILKNGFSFVRQSYPTRCLEIQNQFTSHVRENKNDVIMLIFVLKRSCFHHCLTTKILQCEVPELSKHPQNSYQIQPYKPSRPFSLIRSDVWRPTRVNNITGLKQFISLIDDCMGLVWIFFMKTKSKMGNIFKNYNNMIKTQFQEKFQILRIDNVKEFFNLSLRNYLFAKGIIHNSACSCVDTP